MWKANQSLHSKCFGAETLFKKTHGAERSVIRIAVGTFINVTRLAIISLEAGGAILAMRNKMENILKAHAS